MNQGISLSIETKIGINGSIAIGFYAGLLRDSLLLMSEVMFLSFA